MTSFQRWQCIEYIAAAKMVKFALRNIVSIVYNKYIDDILYIQHMSILRQMNES